MVLRFEADTPTRLAEIQTEVEGGFGYTGAIPLNDWLGVDLGGTWLRWGASSGRLRLEDRSPEAILDQLITVSEGRGVAVSFAGWLCPEGRRVMQGPNLGWVDVPFVEMAAAAVLNCHLENDLDARAWGEYMALETTEPRSLIALNAGSGFALGLVVQGHWSGGFTIELARSVTCLLGPLIGVVVAAISVVLKPYSEALKTHQIASMTLLTSSLA